MEYPSVIKLGSLLGKELQAIWETPAYQAFCKRDFMAPYEVQPGRLLFVGINPSFTETDAGIRYYNPHKEKLHRYFKPLTEIASATKQAWMHLDLLYFRETKQLTLDAILKEPNGPQFIQQQLNLFPALLAVAQPSVIIVANATARKLLDAGHDRPNKYETRLSMPFNWDDELGTYRHGVTPIFFTSMLGGSGALDVGSRKRLEWHIKQVLQKRS